MTSSGGGDSTKRGDRSFRIYLSRRRGFRVHPEDFEDLEDAKLIFERHHSRSRWCLIAEMEPVTQRPIFILHGEASGPRVAWQSIS